MKNSLLHKYVKYSALRLCKIYMQSIGRNVELNIVKRVNNIVPIIVQHCITLGVTYFVRNAVANLVCNVCTKDWLHTEHHLNAALYATKSMYKNARKTRVRSLLHIICIIIVCLTIITLILFRTHTAGLHQATVLIY